jgi:amino acid transporter
MPEAEATTAVSTSASATNYKLAFILVMFTYGGWNDMSYVAAEVRDPSRNLVRALLLGTLIVTGIYLTVNFAFVRLIGLQAVRGSSAVAADAVSAAIGPLGGRVVSALVCVSCLGAINGMIFTGARIYYATGTEHPLFRYLGAWNARLGTPLRSLVLQAITTLAAVVWLGLGDGEKAFEKLLIFTAPVFWFFIACSAVALFVLRFTDAQTPRPYRVLAYPFTPIIFTGSCLFMLYASCRYAWDHLSTEAGVGIALLLLGVVLSWVERRE